MGAFEEYNHLQRWFGEKPDRVDRWITGQEEEPQVVRAWLMWVVLAAGWAVILTTALWGLGL